MKRILPVCLPALTCLGACAEATAVRAQNRCPNVIFILADDLGYGDLGCYGQRTIQTPHLDQMAAEGMRFVNFYAGSTVSAPSRCTLMTGLHTGHCTIRMNAPKEHGNLRPEDRTMAQFFQNRGYRTAMFGKWGLGFEDTAAAPELKGFDEFLGYTSQGQAHSYFPQELITIRNGHSEPVQLDGKYYSHDLFMDRAVEFIRRSADSSKPFFLYLPVTIPHAGMEIPKTYMAPYLNAQGESIFPETPFPGKGLYVPQPYPKAAYASMVTKLDADVGRLLALLEELGIDGNTLVIFTSDNGPHNEGGYNHKDFDSSGGLRGFKRSFHEGGIREPLIARMPGRIAPGTLCEMNFAMWDFFPTFCDLLDAPAPTALDGVSMLPALFGGDTTGLADRLLYWEISQNEDVFVQAARQGRWKLIRRLNRKKGPFVELHDLIEDPTEKHNSAAERPDIVAAMTGSLDTLSKPCSNSYFKSLEDFKYLLP